MNWWDVLKVDSNAGPDTVRLAYLELLKVNKPEDNPEGFKKIRDAFEQAKAHFEHPQPAIEAKQETALHAWVENYRNFNSRIQPESWLELIAAQRSVEDKKVFTQLALGLFEFFLSNPYLPAPVWKVLDEFFAWRTNAEYLGNYFSNDAINFVLYRIANAKWLPAIDTVKFPQDYAHEQIQTYFYQRDQVYRCLRNGEIASIDLCAALQNMLLVVQDEEAFLMLSKVHQRQAEPDQFLNISKQYLAVFPDSLDAQQMYFQALWHVAEHALALDYFHSNLAHQSPGVEVLKLAAACAEAVGNKELADGLYSQAISISPWDYEANFNKYLIHLHKVQASGDKVLFAVERAEVEAFRGYPDHALELLIDAAKSFVYADSACLPSLEKLSMSLLNFNAHSTIVDLLKPLAKSGTTTDVLLFALAEAYRALLKPKVALDLLNRCSVKEEILVPVLWSKSEVLLELRQYEESLSISQNLLAQFPENWMLLHRIGRCFEGLGNRTEALAFYEQALEAEPGRLACYCAVMDQALSLGRVELLQHTFQQLLAREIAPQSVLDYWGVQIAGTGHKV